MLFALRLNLDARLKSYIKSSIRHTVRTACVNPFWYLNLTTWFSGIPLPVWVSFPVQLGLLNPMSAFLRSFRSALDFSARIPRKVLKVGSTLSFLQGGTPGGTDVLDFLGEPRRSLPFGFWRKFTVEVTSITALLELKSRARMFSTLASCASSSRNFNKQ